LPFLSSLLLQTRSDVLPDHLPFHGGWLGWLGYDLAWEIEKLPDRKADTLPFPVAYWYEPDSFAILDHQAQILWLAATKPEDLDKYEQSLTTNPDFEFIDPQPSPLIFYTSQLDYEKAVKKALDYIRKGDIFQANLSLRFQSTTKAKGWQIYRSLQQINPSPFASYWRTPWGEMISCSPERLVKLERGIASTRPIAGTRPRGKTEALDRQLAEELLTNKKEQAEHIMLVDLERNDLGRVCEWGSVYVDELLTIERYSHVMHLVSNVQGKLDKKYHAIDLIKALFPGGTITGCPKVRCLEIIEELEPMRRNLFYGSCGYIDLRGHLDLNILIRTLLMTTQGNLNTVWGQVGAGIVADSDPEKEWLESLHKAEAQLIALRSF
jgi:para-aminobenzoate synthetase component 1